MVQAPAGRLHQYAENPPKKYEDIINPEFCGPDRDGLWSALRDVVLFWVGQGRAFFASTIPTPSPFRSGNG
jgi:starch synthase (maltosyl-transferring)